MRRAFTLLELLITAAIFTVIAFVTVSAYHTGIQYALNNGSRYQAFEQQLHFENRIREVLQSAYLNTTATDTATCFIASTGNGSVTNGGTTTGGTTGAVTNGNSGTGDLASENLPNTLVFTVQGRKIGGAYLAATDTDLQTLNQKFGPVGGVSEIGLSTTAIGDPGDNTGLFIRKQTPADSDHTQGGYESLLDGDVTEIGFEFFNGTQWTTTWDSTQAGQKRLPAAVRVSYILSADPNTTHIFVVRLPLSNVTPTNPVAAGSSTGGTP